MKLAVFGGREPINLTIFPYFYFILVAWLCSVSPEMQSIISGFSISNLIKLLTNQF